MKRIAIAIAVTLALGLAGCETTPTPYQPLGAPGATVAGGFTDQRLDEIHYRVTFKGNDVTSREQVETFMLYRAAELTVSQGFDWFQMVHRDTENRGGAYINSWGGAWSPSWRFRGAGGWGAWGWGDPWGGPGWGGYDVQPINEYEAIAEIAMGHGPRPGVGAFDARQVMANLGPKIVRPAAPAH